MCFRILRSTWILLACAAVLVAHVSQPASAKPEEDDKTHFGELTKDTEHLTGFFDIYTKDGSLYLEIPLESLGKDFLLSPSISRGIGTHGFLGGMPLAYFEAQMLRFEKKDDRIHLIERNTAFTADEGSSMANAVALSYGEAILATFDVESERHQGDEVGVVPEDDDEDDEDEDEDEGDEDDDDADEDDDADADADDSAGDDTDAEDEGDDADNDDSTVDDAEESEEDVEEEMPVISLVINFGDFIKSDVSNLGGALAARFKGSYKVDKNRTTLESVRVYPQNAEFDVNLVFSSNGKKYIDTLPDSRYVPLGIHYSFAALPEHPMMPRLADDRVGYFLTVKKNFSKDSDYDFYVRYINHWRLEKKKPNRDLSEPIKPIVYYMENTIPKEYRKYMKEGVELWQKAFEKAGFKNAILAMDQPDDPEWEAEDLRYSSLRWITSHHASFGAIGPSRVDPRTGEILDADILFEANMVSGFRHTYRRLANAVSVDANGEMEFPWEAAQRLEMEAFQAMEENPGAMHGSGLYCSLGHGFVESGGLLAAALTLRGDMLPGDPVPIKFVGEALRWVVSHEVGHTLGLRHNFKSSMSVPMDKLHDKQYVKENGLYGSVMDYPILNLAAPGEKQGYYFTPVVGTYDDWAIQYGYAPIKNARTPEDERDALNAIASLSADPLHAYGTDEDAYMMGATDPRTGTWDLGEDPLGWAEERAALLSTMWDDLDDRAVGDGQPWTQLTGSYMTLMWQYSRAMGVMAKYIGARHQSRAHRGDPAAGLPFEAVPVQEQRRALRILARTCFAEQPFDMPDDFYGKLTANNFSHWGSSPGIGGRRDFPFHQSVLSVQRTALNRIMNPYTFAKMMDSGLQDPEALTLMELFGTLNTAIWAEIMTPEQRTSVGMGGAVTNGQAISGLRRGIQRDWLKRLVSVSLNGGSSANADARSVARFTLSNLAGDLGRALENEDQLNGYTAAHLQDSLILVTKTLEASYEAEIIGNMKR